MTYSSGLGKLGEDLACKYLVEKGFKVVERNFKKPWGELDIIAVAPDKTLVFVEVKTMSTEFRKNKSLGNNKRTPKLMRGFGGLEPENQMTASKIKKLKRAASFYAGYRKELINEKRGWRVDLITLTKNLNNFLIKHYENIG